MLAEADCVTDQAPTRVPSVRDYAACMGGRCERRLGCDAYWRGDESTPLHLISERLCMRGREQPVQIVRKAA